MIYLATIIVSSMGFGLAFESFLGAELVSGGHAMTHDAWWEVWSAVLLTGLIGWMAAVDGWHRVRRWTRSKGGLQSLRLGVSGMTCGGCVRRLETAVTAVRGAAEVRASLDPGGVEVTGLVDEAEVRAAVEKAGFKVI